MKQLWVTPLFACLLLSLCSAQAAQPQRCDLQHTPQLTPNSRYIKHSDGTVTDQQTGLMWQVCSHGQSGDRCQQGQAQGLSWQQALQYAATTRNKGLLSYHDWRLPTQAELRTLVNRQCNYPAINTEIFPTTPPYWFWSISPMAGDGTFSWGISFDYGYDSLSGKGTNGMVRLVRYEN